MKRHIGRLLSILVLLSLLAATGLVGAQGGGGTVASGAPTVVSYQGQVAVDGTPYHGAGYFKFAVVDGAGTATFWSNDGTSSGEPANAVSLTVANGLFNVLLGDTALPYMTALPASAFDGTDRALRVWFGQAAGGPFTQLEPDRRIAAVPYALQAEQARNAWHLDGNAGTTAGTDFVGTTDNQALEVKVNANRALRLEPHVDSPNLIGGYSGNSVASDTFGAVIAGGGQSGNLNRVVGHLGVIGGGQNNLAGSDDGNVGNATMATVGGGANNVASGTYSTIAGGTTNSASGRASTVAGGANNVAGGDYAFAAGRRAGATLAGCFVWGDSTDADVACTTANQFVARATGGVSFDTGGSGFQIDGHTAWHAGNDGAGSALDADTVDGQHASAFQQHYANVVVVAKSGGDYDTITAALDSITDNSETSRYLIWVAPGTYIEMVTMKEYVDIEGAGEISTRITYPGSGSENTGTVVGANNAELRFLTVENTGGSTYAVAIYNTAASPRLTHLTANASGGAESYGVYNYSSSSPTMTNVTATASGGTYGRGVYNRSSSPTMTNVTATASGGTAAYGVYNRSYSSPTMTNVTLTASGGNSSYGVGNDTSSPTMTNVTVAALGGADRNYGVYNLFSSPVMTNVTATGSGGTSNAGMYSSHSSPTIQNSTLRAHGGGGNYGIYNYAVYGAHTVIVNNSQIVGSTSTILNPTYFTVRVGASKLDGGVVTGGGTFVCVFVYDASYTALGATCQ